MVRTAVKRSVWADRCAEARSAALHRVAQLFVSMAASISVAGNQPHKAGLQGVREGNPTAASRHDLDQPRG
jgi:hypothetical protein